MGVINVLNPTRSTDKQAATEQWLGPATSARYRCRVIRKLHPFANSARTIGRIVYRYAEHYDAWPSVREIVRMGTSKRIGKYRRIYGILCFLRDAGLAELMEAGRESGWRLTAEGYRFIGKEPLSVTNAHHVSRTVRNNPPAYRVAMKAKKKGRRYDVIQAFDTMLLPSTKYDWDAEPDSGLPIME